MENGKMPEGVEDYKRANHRKKLLNINLKAKYPFFILDGMQAGGRCVHPASNRHPRRQT